MQTTSKPQPEKLAGWHPSIRGEMRKEQKKEKLASGLEARS